MEELVRFTKTDTGTELCFESSFPTVLKISVNEKSLCRLGDTLCRLASKKRGGFEWEAKVKADWGVFVFKVCGRVCKGIPALELEYAMPHYKFKAISQCFSRYDTFSFEGLLQFGEGLKRLVDGKSAVLYSCPCLSDNPFNE